jgi:hypothetical protein
MSKDSEKLLNGKEIIFVPVESVASWVNSKTEDVIQPLVIIAVLFASSAIDSLLAYIELSHGGKAALLSLAALFLWIATKCINNVYREYYTEQKGYKRANNGILWVSPSEEKILRHTNHKYITELLKQKYGNQTKVDID